MKAIRVWRICDAPLWLRAIGDPDDREWIAVVPKEFGDGMPLWMDGTAFGCCETEKHDLPNGDKVYIGYHA